jgi:hypothetical protein
MRPGKIVAAALVLLLLCVLIAWLVFQPGVANHFGYALPVRNGLPCRISVSDRDFDNNEQCGGMNRGSWIAWYDARHHVTPGGACETKAQLHGENDLPLRLVGGIATLFGTSHAILSPQPGHGLGAPTVLFVEDNGCFRPYSLSGGQ